MSSGLELKILQSGDAGELVSKALLTAGNPQGDVLFGLDNTFLSRALEGDLFEPYESPFVDRVDGRYVLDPEHRVTPIDHGDVCVNYDKEVVRGPRYRAPALARRSWRRAAGRPSRRREPRDLDSRTCLPPRHDRASRRAGLEGLLAHAPGARRPRRRRLGGGVQRAVHQSRRRQPTDRRLLRVEPAGRGHLREPAARGGPHRGRRGQLLQPDRVRRGAPGGAERGGSTRARRLHASEALPGGHPALDVRLPRE